MSVFISVWQWSFTFVRGTAGGVCACCNTHVCVFYHHLDVSMFWKLYCVCVCVLNSSSDSSFIGFCVSASPSEHANELMHIHEEAWIGVYVLKLLCWCKGISWEQVSQLCRGQCVCPLLYQACLSFHLSTPPYRLVRTHTICLTKTIKNPLRWAHTRCLSRCLALTNTLGWDTASDTHIKR